MLPVIALSATLRLALNVLAVVGVNLTAIVHLAPAASELPQPLLWLKAVTLEPAIEMPVILNGVAPGLLRVTFRVLLVPRFTVPNDRLVGLILARGLITSALRTTGWGLPGALSMICNVAVCWV